GATLLRLHVGVFDEAVLLVVDAGVALDPRVHEAHGVAPDAADEQEALLAVAEVRSPAPLPVLHQRRRVGLMVVIETEKEPAKVGPGGIDIAHLFDDET